jgi:hypothetical protein
MTPAGSSWYSEADLPLAKEDMTVQIEVAGVMVDRKIVAGTRVPPDLIDAYEAGGTAPAESSGDDAAIAAPARGARRR